MNADGSAILWSPSDVAPAVSTSGAYSWSSLSGVLPQGAYVASDGSNVNNFYAYDRPNGKLYVSTNKGSNWTLAASVQAWADQMTTPYGQACDIWLSVYNGLYHNTNCGSGTWTQIPGVTQAKAVGFGKPAGGQTYPTIYMIGTITNGVMGVYRSTDIGAHWVQINDSQHQYGGVNSITGDPKTFGTVYLGTGGRGIIMGTSSN